MEMRNNICAHNGNDPRLEDSIVKNEHTDKIEISFKVKLTLPSMLDINNILKNIEIVYEYLHNSMKKTAEKLSKEIGKNVTISDAMGQASKS
ncbi:hypothetical protein [Komagataeibacter oboediens]|uniref:hypothetical protein n=1 Tax=Komagataeibacter oboediens TaxID=65958 RepID=UPI001C2D42CC|nr:hypothetical protein [Komagataeibacter oboediens]MBV1824958.1 hypothetical protein [Komagataeibacter oboediens]